MLMTSRLAGVILHLSESGYVDLCVKGTSMRPWLESGSVIRAVKYSKLVVGKSYVIISNQALLAHRLVRVHNQICLFIGDNSGSIEVTNKEMVLGVFDDGTTHLFRRFISTINVILITIFHGRNRLPYKAYLLRTLLIKVWKKIDWPAQVLEKTIWSI